MGREIRRVPPDWQHPKAEGSRGGDQPMHDQTFEDAAREWKEEFAKWEAGERPSYYSADREPQEFWEYHGAPPEREYYRPWKDEEATWFQVWETVTEGTPVTPPFATKEDLIAYLAEHGTSWDRNARERGWESGPPGWGYDRAKAFVDSGWVPSMMIAGGKLLDSKDIALELAKSNPA